MRKNRVMNWVLVMHLPSHSRRIHRHLQRQIHYPLTAPQVPQVFFPTVSQQSTAPLLVPAFSIKELET